MFGIVVGVSSPIPAFAEVDTDKLVYSKGELVKISGSIDFQDTDERVNIIEIEITDSNNNIVVNEYTPINVDNEFSSSYDTITWATGDYKVTISYNEDEEIAEFEIAGSSSSSSDEENDDNNESNETAGDNSNGQESSSSTSSVRPNPPADLKADVVSSTQIDLSWSLSDNNDDSSITGFKVEARINTDPNYSVIVANTGSTDTIYSHTGLTSDTVYAYRVYAINSSGESDPSSSTTVKTPNNNSISSSSSNTEIEVSDIPTDVQAKVISPTSVELSWNPPTQTYDQAIQGYTIKQEIASDVYNEIANTVGSNTYYTISNLQTDQTYTFVVVANYLIGSSDISEDVTVTLSSSTSINNDNDDESDNDNLNNDDSFSGTPDDVPDRPVNLNTKPISSTEIELSWSTPDNDSDNNDSITGYKIEVRTNNDTSFSVVIDDTESTDTTYSHDGLVPNTTYIYRVFAINEVGTSEPSSENLANTLITDSEEKEEEGDTDSDSGSTQNDDDSNNTDNNTSLSPTNVPGQPIDLQAVPISQSRINLSWSAPIDTGDSPLIGYKIESKTSNEPDYSVLVTNTGNPSTTTYSHTGLIAGDTYHYRVYAINSSGEGNPSDMIEATIISADNEQSDTQQQSLSSPTLQPLQVTLSTDKSMYGPDDPIVISGTTNDSTQTIPLGMRIVSSDGTIVYARSVAISADNTFETIISPSQHQSSSWKNNIDDDREFTVEVTYNGRIQATTTFANEAIDDVISENTSSSSSSSSNQSETNKEQQSSSLPSSSPNESVIDDEANAVDTVITNNEELETLKNQNTALQSANQQLRDENNQLTAEIEKLNEKIEQLDIVIKEQVRVMLETLGIS